MATIEDGWRALDDLKPNPLNFNQHTKEGVIEKMAARVRCNAFTAPFIVTPDGLILGGHLRRLGLMKLRSDSYPEPEGVKPGWIVPVRVFTGNEVQERAILVGDNPAIDDLEYDNEALASLLADLQQQGGLEGAGYDDAALDRLIGDLAEQAGGGAGESGLLPNADVDEIPEQVETRCQPGDLWSLGAHRLLCGDSTRAEDVARLMDGERAALLLTDPPYGMRLDTDYTGMPECGVKSKKYAPVEGDAEDFDPSPVLLAFDAVREQLWWGADYYHHQLPAGGSWIVWDKRTEGTEGLVGNHFEVCWSRQHHRREIKRHHWCGYTAHDPGETRTHPTQKPVALFVELIEQFSERGDVVADAYLGSGTLIVAAEKVGRKAYGIEIDPAHCSTALARWEKATGRTAELLQRAPAELREAA